LKSEKIQLVMRMRNNQSRFVLLVDESGEAGISRVRASGSPGASPYMTLGAALVLRSQRDQLNLKLNNLREEFGVATLHCSRLKHQQIVRFCREIAEMRIRLFGLISLKKTLGTYRSDIESDSKKYYNKCVQLLLERVGFFMQHHKFPPNDLEIVFEKANVDYVRMKSLIHLCQKNPHRPNTKRLRAIDAQNIIAKSKEQEPLLQIADLVAHALYKCVDKTSANAHVTEPRYVKELQSRFFGHPETNSVVDGGLFCVHQPWQLQLDRDVLEVINTLTADPPT